MTAFKSLLFLILAPGLLAGYLPHVISKTDIELFEPGLLRYIAIPLWLIGGISMLWCFWNFLVTGKGTPAPIDPPKELVATGLYRFVRNPMYLAGITGLLGWLIWSPSLPLIVAPPLFFNATHLFVTRYEEPTLRKKFGAAYEDYCRQVPRWFPRFK